MSHKERTMRIEGKDYTKSKDDVLVIKLPDTTEPGLAERMRRFFGASDGAFEVSILPPTKKLYDELAEVVEALSKLEDEDSEFDLDGAVSTVSRLMSRNAEKRQITPQQLEDMGFDIEDIGEFIGSYLFFVNELVQGKN